MKHTIRTEAGTRNVSLTPMKAIRLMCVECVGWATHGPKSCRDLLCPLHPYRTGHNPKRKGIGGKPPTPTPKARKE